MGLVLAILVALVTLGLAGAVLFAAGMSTSPTASEGARQTALLVLAVGLVLALVLGVSHFHPLRW